jgi:phage repressor protein C with HTH and peptisase S24 domain
MNRRTLTAEETAEARRLAAAWVLYRAEHPGVTQAWLASETGLGTQGAVSQYLRGVIPLNVEALMAICRVIGANPSHISPRLAKIVEIPGSTLSNDELYRMGFRPVRVVEDDDPYFTHIPKVKLRLSAGITGFEVEPEDYDGSTTAVPTGWIQRNGYSRDKLIAIHVKGESMEPTVYDGDLVVLNTADTEPVDGGVYAINYEGEPLIKRMERDAGQWWLKSDNLDQRKHGRKVCQGDACILVGRVVRKESTRF